MFSQIFGSFLEGLSGLQFLLAYWWFWLFCVLIVTAWITWITYVREYWYYISNPWTLYEIKIPAELQRGPAAMESLLHVMHTARYQPDVFLNTDGSINWHDFFGAIKDQIKTGEFVIHNSIEVTSHNGEINFYLRVPGRYRQSIEAAFYANYPDIELRPVDDYIYRYPPTYDDLLKRGLQLFGSELTLRRNAVLPLRTYMDIEGKDKDWDRLDPISQLIELIGKIKPGETVWVQFLIRSSGGRAESKWKKEAAVEIQKKWDEWKSRPSEPGVTFRFPDRKPGDQKVVEAMQEKESKPLFDVILRYIYIAPKEIWSYNFGRGILPHPFTQYASGSLNSMGHNYGAITQAAYAYFPYSFPVTRYRLRARIIYYRYRRRIMQGITFDVAGRNWNPFDLKIAPYSPKEVMKLSTTELATLIHLPTYLVTTGPFVKRVEAKRLGAPAGLAIYGEEEPSA